MCLGCNCPEPIPPPNQTIKKCRFMLQILAGSLLALGILGIVCSLVFQFFYDLLLIYMLYMSWTTFNWCMSLAFFLFCTIQTVQSIIIFIGMIQYGQMFDKKNLVLSLYCILSLAYYPVAVYFSHYCYKNFKNNFSANGQMFPMNRPGGNGGQAAEGGNYQRVREQQQGQPPNFGGRNNANQQPNVEGNDFFRGQGVRIG